MCTLSFICQLGRPFDETLSNFSLQSRNISLNIKGKNRYTLVIVHQITSDLATS